MSRNKKKKKTRPAERAVWRKDPANMLYVSCSACGFRIETLRAVETGWSSSDHVRVKYAFCPACGKPMSVDQGPEQQVPAAAAAGTCMNQGAGHDPDGQDGPGMGGE